MVVTLDNIESLNIKRIKHNTNFYFVKYHKEYKRIQFASKISEFDKNPNSSSGWSYSEAINRGFLSVIIEYDKKPELIVW
jgi:hypothetical protein